MDTAGTSDARPLLGAWRRRVRLALAVAAVWAGLHYLANQTVLTRGLDRPVILVAADSGLTAGLLVGALVLAGAYVGTLLAGGGDGTSGLIVVGLALTLWVAPGGTMDDWLLLKNDAPTPPTGAPYWSLLGDYVFLAVLMAAVALISGWAALGGKVTSHAERLASLRKTLALNETRTQRVNGIIAALTNAAVAAVLLLILTGPQRAQTHRGQVFFAVAVAFVVSAIVARRLTGVRHPLWYWTAPPLVGAAGLLWAAWDPSLPQPYEHLNNIPPTGLARPLPVEMVGLGTVATLWTLRAAARFSDESRAG